MTETYLSGRPADSQDLYCFHSYAQVTGAGLRAPDERQETFQYLLYRFVLQVTQRPGSSSCDVSLFDGLSNVFAPRTQGDS